MATVFIAYPSEPAEIGQTVAGAVSQLRGHRANDVFKPWPELEVAGRFIASEVLRGIAESTLLVADISVLNFNVTYEVGYAIGQKKSVLLTRYAALGDASPRFGEIGIFDTIGFKAYQNSSELNQLVDRHDASKNLAFDAESINRKQPLYLLDGRVKTDQLVRIKSRIKKPLIFFREYDPLETARLSPFEAIANVAQSAGVVVSLLPTEHRDSVAHNLRSAFVAGLAAGMSKHVLIIQLGDDPVPIDYRDLVKVAKHPTQIDEAIAEFAPGITEVLQGIDERVDGLEKSALATLALGASAAENEFRELGNYYIETDAFHRSLRGEVKVVLGRKGSGKSALFWQVRDRLKRERRRIVVDLKPDGYKLLKFKEDVLSLLQEGTLEHTIMAFWEYLILLEVAYKLLEKDREVHLKDHRIYEHYRTLHAEYAADEYVSEGDFSERTSKLVERIRNDFTSLYRNRGKEIRLTSAEVTELLFRHDIAKLRKSILEYLTFKRGVWVLIDNIDKGWPTNGIQREDLIIVRTLIDALSKIERQLSMENGDCRSIVFLRNDVYELLVMETPDRGKVSSERLDWTDKEALRELLRLRLVYSGMPEDAEFPALWRGICISHIRGEETSEYIIQRSLMRPRELLNAVMRCRSQSVNRGRKKIEESDIDDGLRSHARDLIEEISLEIRDVFPEVEDAVYLLIGAPRVVERDELMLRFIDHGVDEKHWERLVDIFLWYGVLGFAKSTDDGLYIYDASYDLKLLKGQAKGTEWKGTKLIINPAFWAALGVVDPTQISFPGI